ncbi:MAG: hypothetical protein QOG69_1850 [Actinomycetota bacterium]|nr:hypothetical protein [Actinomycetota bacterium]
MTSLRERDPSRRAEEAVRAVLPRTAKVRTGRSGTAIDLFVNDLPLRIDWIGEGRLADAKRVLAMRRERPDVVVARQLSPGARELLAEAGIGWVDETGAAEIAAGMIVVSRTGQPPKRAESPKRWTPSVIAVAEALLCGTKATVSATEAATGLSNGSCTTALRVLTDLGLLEADAGRGRDWARRVADADRLLDGYAAAVEAVLLSSSLQVGVTWQDSIAGLAATGEKWDKAKIEWASTGTVAATLLAPYLSAVTGADVYVDADTILGLEAVAAAAKLRPIEGGRLTLRPFPTVTAQRLATVIDGVRVAPWPRVYADVRTVGVRGEEAAEHLREAMHGR